MRIVVVGATGNLGTSLLDALAADPAVDEIVGVARRLPQRVWPRTEFRARDIVTDDLDDVFAGADAVVHLAWWFQPTRSPELTWRVNVGGSERVFAAAGRARIRTLLYASSIGAYSPAPGTVVDESWPTHSRPEAGYGREKAYVERLLDVFAACTPDTRVVRVRPAFLFKPAAASEQWRIFAGRLLPHLLARTPLLPYPRDLRFPVLHTDDAAAAVQAALHLPVSGAFNLAAEPAIDGRRLADLMGARLVPLPPRLVRTGLAGAWHARLVPAEPALLDLLANAPLLDTTRAREELGWAPRVTATAAVRGLLDGLAAHAGEATPPLAAAA